MIRSYLVWKQVVDEDALLPVKNWEEIEEQYGESPLRFITPLNDPMIHEHPMDLMFNTVSEAVEALVDYGCLEIAIEEDWQLCLEEVTTTAHDWRKIADKLAKESE